jgi:hypothetical protein
MERHDSPHDRNTCPRCLQLRRQEFVVPDDLLGVVEEVWRQGGRPTPPLYVHPETLNRFRKYLEPDDPNDPELLWGDPPPA